MKVVILAGGLGTRISEQTKKMPKPMIKIGKKPILDHIINIYKKFGYNDFIICSGYKRKIIEKYFKKNKRIKVINTGLKTQTAARLKKIKKYITEENFFMTYGDGLSNINIKKLLSFHKKHQKIATLSAVRPIPRFGSITISKNKIIIFKEKDKLKEGWINGGFFVLNKKVFDYIDDRNDCIFEKEPLEILSKKGELMAFKHDGFWHPIDTMRDKKFLDSIYKNKKKLF